jgi:hypothetical protein
VICGSMPFENGSSDWAQIQHEMDNGVLLLCYLDKICLTLTGDFWQALASLYSESQAIKGSQNGGMPSVDYTTFYRQHLCVNEGSRPQQHTWNSKALFFPAQIYCCTQSAFSASYVD